MQQTITVITTITRGHLGQIQATGIEEVGLMETTLTHPTEVLTTTLPSILPRELLDSTSLHAYILYFHHEYLDNTEKLQAR